MQVNTSVSQLNAKDVFRLKPGAIHDAIQKSSENGADDVFFKVDKDFYVASGEGLDTSDLKAGDSIKYGDKMAKVTFVDQEVNTLGEGITSAATTALGVAIGAGGLIGGGLGFFATGWNPAKVAAKAGLQIGATVAAVTGLGTLAIGAIMGASSHADYSVLHQFADNK